MWDQKPWSILVYDTMWRFPWNIYKIQYLEFYPSNGTKRPTRVILIYLGIFDSWKRLTSDTLRRLLHSLTFVSFEGYFTTIKLLHSLNVPFVFFLYLRRRWSLEFLSPETKGSPLHVGVGVELKTSHSGIRLMGQLGGSEDQIYLTLYYLLTMKFGVLSLL